jgi:hypothetical protein
VSSPDECRVSSTLLGSRDLVILAYVELKNTCEVVVLEVMWYPNVTSRLRDVKHGNILK